MIGKKKNFVTILFLLSPLGRSVRKRGGKEGNVIKRIVLGVLKSLLFRIILIIIIIIRVRIIIMTKTFVP